MRLLTSIMNLLWFCWEAIVLRFGAAALSGEEVELVLLEIDTQADEGYAFGLETHSLFETELAGQQYLAT